MKVLVTGGAGLVGHHLGAHDGVIALDRSGLDVCDPASVHAALDHHRPTIVIHTAAFTNVDASTLDPARAYRVNAGGAELVARACASRGVRLLHLSTDYVLEVRDEPGYRTPVDAPAAPASTYARSKWAGEQAIAAIGGHIVRVQWVYSLTGASFVNRAVEAMRRGESVPLVTDQVGCPTPAPLLATWLLELGDQPVLPPVIHLATRGEATPAAWVSALARARGVTPVWHPILRSALTGAARPARSCLDVSGTAPLLTEPVPTWHAALAQTSARATAAQS